MPNPDHLLAIGVMTGNSLDGVDVVLTRFTKDGVIEDLVSHGTDLDASLANDLRRVRAAINDCQGNMEKAIGQIGTSEYWRIHDSYMNEIVIAIDGLRAKAASLPEPIEPSQIDVIGLHGQTCAHLPPSVAKTSDAKNVYTVQIGSGQKLADLTNTTVIYDFRSDDVMNGGEGAPLAPMHHFHLADSARKKGHFPLAFCNAGNTGNITVISEFTGSGKLALFGWDTGPFNNYPDRLMQAERGVQCDFDGKAGAAGQVNLELLKLLFERAVITTDGANFLEKHPPKSSDPQWYLLLPELLGSAPVAGQALSFEDRIRTAEYFSAYIFAQSLSLIPNDVVIPSTYAICGGGWKNPVARRHFEDLLQGRFGNENPILPNHEEFFRTLKNRMPKPATVVNSEEVGFDSTAMEARIFADAAVARVKGEPFTSPDTTGCRAATVCGILRFPGGDINNATANLKGWLNSHNSLNRTSDFATGEAQGWSRAAAGWQERLSLCK
ncbi:MAG: anhydro-N-acetylmuramic acid kinase [Candidatus Obscuribacterales bacterium]|nr:anhydro-N-acetylmuramic acid kinase [Candidatus Obscuribacterales bacterium]